MSRPAPLLLRHRGFLALTLAQFFETLNDSAFKTLVTFWALAKFGAEQGGRGAALVSGLFILPFLLFSTYAGRLADARPKRSVAIAMKVYEIAIMALGGWALRANSFVGLLGVVFLSGLHSTFFGPAKYGLLPEILEPRDLSNGNGIVQLTSFLAIIAGTPLAARLMKDGDALAGPAGGIFMAVALAGFLASLMIPRTPAAGARGPADWNPARRFWRDMAEVRKDRPLYLSVLGGGYFWLVGTLIFIGLPVYAKTQLGGDEALIGRLMTVLSLGIALGSGLAGKLSGNTVELGLVPLGALGLGLAALDLAFAAPNLHRVMWDLALLGAAGGFFIVPLNALLQSRSPRDRRGTMVATANIVSFLGIGGASLVYFLLTDPLALGYSPARAWFLVALGALGATVYVFSLLAPAVIRFAAWVLTHTGYRVTTLGAENIPARGGALLVSNHLSYADPFLMTAAVPRRVRFMMMRPLYNYRPLTWFFKMMGAIPIAGNDGPKKFMASIEQARQALREGYIVCIFAEGAISRLAQLLGFRKGLEAIAKDLDVPIVPVHLDRVWGSVFSFERGKFIWKMPRQIPYPVTVSFGTALPSSTRADRVRQDVLELASRAFEQRLAGLRPLHQYFFRIARRQWFHPAVSDSTGLRLGYGRLVTAAAFLAGKLDVLLPSEKNVGILLPPGVPGLLTNLALLFAGRVPVNLNYSLGRPVVDQICRDAGVSRVITARKMLEALKWGEEPRAVYLEDLPRPSKLRGLWMFAGLRALPARWAERWWLPKSDATMDDVAALLFTSGSTGQPKGVTLTHKNVHANIQGLQETFQLTPRDKIVGVLPFFHSFGFTGTMWLPILAGAQAAYHRSPLEPLAIKKLIKEEKATVLLATPTFLQMWLKKFTREDVATLRFALTGAEKLQPGFAKDFQDTLGVPLLEGYGTTELSPAACVSVLDVHHLTEHQIGHKPGKVGRPLPGVSVRIVDPESGAAVPDGRPGLLLVKGPNVMRGYWGLPEKTAEVLRDGWYVTGDIAAVDEDGFVEITDRLSRFSKIGGEMVPHMLVERRLWELSGEPEAQFLVLSAPDEKKGEKLVVLHFNVAQDIDALVAKLAVADMPRLWIPDRRCFYKIDAWPTLASGKVDMVSARKIAQNLLDASPK